MVDELRERIENEFVVESGGWVTERIDRVTGRLRAANPDVPHLDTLVLWSELYNAWTWDKTIYVSRRLFELFSDDDACAFLLAHELAHHVLGHVPNLSLPSHVLPIQLVIRAFVKWVASRRNERDADLLAIEMCVAAGYDPEKCLALVDAIQKISLDYGDIDGAYGDGHGRTHPSGTQRRSAIRNHLAAMTTGHRLADELAARRRERTRKLAIVGSAAAGIALFVLIRKRPRWL